MTTSHHKTEFFVVFEPEYAAYSTVQNPKVIKVRARQIYQKPPETIRERGVLVKFKVSISEDAFKPLETPEIVINELQTLIAEIAADIESSK